VTGSCAAAVADIRCELRSSGGGRLGVGLPEWQGATPGDGGGEQMSEGRTGRWRVSHWTSPVRGRSATIVSYARPPSPRSVLISKTGPEARRCGGDLAWFAGTAHGDGDTSEGRRNVAHCSLRHSLCQVMPLRNGLRTFNLTDIIVSGIIVQAFAQEST
jgi:hypothetical protein